MPEPYVASVEVEADPEQVFKYFVEPERLTKWMGRRADLDPAPGGRFDLDIYRINVRGRYLEVDPPHRILLTWGHEGSAVLPPGSSIVEITLTRRPGGTLVRVEHRNLPVAELDGHRVGWEHFLARLTTAATGDDPGIDPWLESMDRERAT